MGSTDLPVFLVCNFAEGSELQRGNNRHEREVPCTRRAKDDVDEAGERERIPCVQLVRQEAKRRGLEPCAYLTKYLSGGETPKLLLTPCTRFACERSGVRACLEEVERSKDEATEIERVDGNAEEQYRKSEEQPCHEELGKASWHAQHRVGLASREGRMRTSSGSQESALEPRMIAESTMRTVTLTAFQQTSDCSFGEMQCQ